jgi:hypothetical protein
VLSSFFSFQQAQMDEQSEAVCGQPTSRHCVPEMLIRKRKQKI